MVCLAPLTFTGLHNCTLLKDFVVHFERAQTPTHGVHFCCMHRIPRSRLAEPHPSPFTQPLHVHVVQLFAFVPTSCAGVSLLRQNSYRYLIDDSHLFFFKFAFLLRHKLAFAGQFCQCACQCPCMAINVQTSYHTGRTDAYRYCKSSTATPQHAYFSGWIE